MRRGDATEPALIGKQGSPSDRISNNQNELKTLDLSARVFLFGADVNFGADVKSVIKGLARTNGIKDKNGYLENTLEIEK